MTNFPFRPRIGLPQRRADSASDPARLLRGDSASYPPSLGGPAAPAPAGAKAQARAPGPAAAPDKSPGKAPTQVEPPTIAEEAPQPSPAGPSEEPAQAEPVAEAVAPVPAAVSASSPADAGDAASWDEPNLSVFDEPAAPEPVLEEFLGGAMDEELRALARHVGSHLAVTATVFLAYLGGLLGHRVAVDMGSTWREILVMWCFVIAPSGSQKSAAMRHFLEDVRDLEREEGAGWAAHLREVDRHNLVAEIKLGDYRAAVAAAVRAGAELPVPPDVEPIDLPSRNPPQIIIDDVTLPALTAAHAHTCNVSGLLALPDEAVSLFDRIARRPDERAALLRSHGGGHYRADRRTRAQIDIPRFAISILGSGVPGGLPIGQIADGFSARVLWVVYGGEEEQPIPDQNLQTPATREALRRARRLVREAKGQLLLPLAADARERFNLLAAEWRGKARTGQGHIASWCARAPSHVLRLAGLREVCLAVHAGVAPTEVSLASIEAAATAVERFFAPMAQRVLGTPAAAEQSKIIQLAEAIATHAAPTPDGRIVVNRRNLRKKVGGDLARGPVFYPLWNALERAGLLRAAPRRDGALGRTSGDYEVNPALAVR